MISCLRCLHIGVSIIHLLDHLIVVDVALTPDEAADTTAGVSCCFATGTQVAKHHAGEASQGTCLVDCKAQAAHPVQLLEDQWLHPLAAMHIW